MKKRSSLTFGVLVGAIAALADSNLTAAAYPQTDAMAKPALAEARQSVHALQNTTNAPLAARDLIATQVAIVVREESNGVTIIRNVKEFRDSGKSVAGDTLIGNTDLLRPVYFLDEEERKRCERRLRTIGDNADIKVKVENVTYCE